MDRSGHEPSPEPKEPGPDGAPSGDRPRLLYSSSLDPVLRLQRSNRMTYSSLSGPLLRHDESNPGQLGNGNRAPGQGISSSADEIERLYKVGDEDYLALDEATDSDSQREAWHRIRDNLRSLPPRERIEELRRVRDHIGVQRKPARKQDEPEWSSSRYVVDAIEEISPLYSLDDIGGHQDIKHEIETIAAVFKNPGVMKKWGVEKPQGVLLYGEPGTGKTMFAHAIASKIGADLWSIDSSKLYDMWNGLSGKNIQAVFSRIRDHKGRLVVLFDEIDSIISSDASMGAGRAGQAQNQVAGLFKQALNELSRDKPDALIVATTNALEGMDPALVRSGRFNYKLYVPMPDEQARTEIISTLIADSIASEAPGTHIYQRDISVAEITRLTQGMSGADLSEIFRRIKLGKAVEESNRGSAPPISQQDIIRQISNFRTRG